MSKNTQSSAASKPNTHSDSTPSSRAAAMTVGSMTQQHAATMGLEQLIQTSHTAVQSDDWASLLPLAQQWFARQPRSDIGNYYLGLAHAMHQHWGLALVYLQRAVELRPYIAPAQFHLGRVLQQLGQHAGAIEALRWCILLSPRHANAHALLGDSQQVLGQFAAAAQSYQTLQTLSPQWAGLNLAIAKALLDARQTDAATPYFEAALQATQHAPNVQWEYAMQLLMQGQFERGWQYHESRLTLMGWQALHSCPLPDPPYPTWAGESLAGKTLLIHGEQGIGDEIMFASIVPELIEQAALVVIACHPSLVALYRHSFPAAHIVAHPRGQPEQWHHQLPPWLGELASALTTRRAAGDPHLKPISGVVDYHCPTGSLARYTRNRVAQFPALAYLSVEPDRQAVMGARLNQAIAQQTHASTPLRIGVVWAGNLSNPTAALRSIDLAQLLPLRRAFPDAVFVSLQSREHAHLCQSQPEMRLIDLSAHTDDFADVAALMLQLDCIVTVDTAFVHIAGGLGCKTYLLQSFRGEWRWGERNHRHQGVAHPKHGTADHALWYPNVAIMRQAAVGDWASAINATVTHLQTHHNKPTNNA
jgi:tetratricopeptide (TPR) repeat protein